MYWYYLKYRQKSKEICILDCWRLIVKLSNLLLICSRVEHLPFSPARLSEVSQSERRHSEQRLPPKNKSKRNSGWKSCWCRGFDGDNESDLEPEVSSDCACMTLTQRELAKLLNCHWPKEHHIGKTASVNVLIKIITASSHRCVYLGDALCVYLF